MSENREQLQYLAGYKAARHECIEWFNNQVGYGCMFGFVLKSKSRLTDQYIARYEAKLAALMLKGKSRE